MKRGRETLPDAWSLHSHAPYQLDVTGSYGETRRRTPEADARMQGQPYTAAAAAAGPTSGRPDHRAAAARVRDTRRRLIGASDNEPLTGENEPRERTAYQAEDRPGERRESARRCPLHERARRRRGGDAVVVVAQKGLAARPGPLGGGSRRSPRMRCASERAVVIIAASPVTTVTRAPPRPIALSCTYTPGKFRAS